MATLVYSLDAKNPSSYPGSGSSWFNVSGNTYSPLATATLYNSPTFTTDGGLKYFKFSSASQQYADFPMAAQNAGAFPSSTLAYQIYQQSQSIAIWVRVDSALQPWIDPSYNAGYQGTIVTSSLSLAGNENVQFDISAGNCGTVAGTSAISAGWRAGGSKFGAGSLLPSIGQWYFLVGVYRKTGALSGFVDFYVNAVFNGTVAATSGSGDVFSGTFVQNNYLARSALANGQGAKPASIIFSDISVSQFQIYQGALSASEITTLYDNGSRVAAPVNQRGVPPELGLPVITRQFSWNEMARRSWGSEFSAPDRRVYEFSNGRGFDSTDRGDTGFYEPPST